MGQQARAAGKGLGAVSCPDSRMCVADSFNGDVFIYSGSRWAVSARVARHGDLEGVSCPTARYCATVTDGGYALTGT
jgi:hypothetical protein